MAGLTLGRSRGTGLRSDAASPLHDVDWVLAAASGAIALFGLLMVYSATQQKLHDAGLDPYMYLKRQAAWVTLGVLVMVVVATIDYRVFRDSAPLVYAGTVFLLLLVLTPIGSLSRGTQGWFQLGPFQFQPSEVGKVALLVCVASYCTRHRGEIDNQTLAIVLGLAALPMGLIYLQPDLGTDLVFAAILLAMLVVAGAKPKQVAFLAVVGLLGVVTVLELGVLKKYQVDRLGAFLDPKGDTQLSAYNLRQSQIAMGSGGVTGKGLFRGTQTNLSFVPEQHTDFIFTVVGEELGFLGAAVLLGLFAIVVWRTWRTSMLARDQFGTLVCVGVLAMLVFQIFENAGMTMGIMPITGIPLPFMSYGGSATLASFAAVGLVLNVHMRRFV